jgi:hypothetical protein
MTPAACPPGAVSGGVRLDETTLNGTYAALGQDPVYPGSLRYANGQVLPLEHHHGRLDGL